MAKDKGVLIPVSVLAFAGALDDSNGNIFTYGLDFVGYRVESLFLAADLPGESAWAFSLTADAGTMFSQPVNANFRT
jgi:hypothetical protein